MLKVSCICNARVSTFNFKNSRVCYKYLKHLTFSNTGTKQSVSSTERCAIIDLIPRIVRIQ